MLPDFVKSRLGVFYGWFVLVGIMLSIFTVVGSFFNSFGVFMPVICADFGWSRSVVSLGMSLGLVCFGLPGPLWGFLSTKFGPRVNIIVGNLLAAAGLAGMSLVQEVWHIYLCYIITGLGAGLGGYVPATTVLTTWFNRKRPLVMGMFMACAGLGGFVFPPLTTFLISSVGWRTSWLVLAGLVAVGASLIGGVFLVRNKPEDIGEVPDGVAAEPPQEAETAEHAAGLNASQLKLRVGQIVRMPTSWLIVGFTVAYALITGTVTTHQVAYVQDLGFSAMTAAMTMSILSAMSLTGSLVFGALAMRFKIRYLLSAFFGIQLMALIILLTVDNLPFICVYAVLLGAGNGAALTALPTIVGAYYGQANYAKVIGIFIAFQTLANAGAATLAGAVHDATGTYIPAFIVITVFSFIGLICAYMARKPKLPYLADAPQLSHK
jgi:MFS family permease